jgi:hypothetical protein
LYRSVQQTETPVIGLANSIELAPIASTLERSSLPAQNRLFGLDITEILCAVDAAFAAGGRSPEQLALDAANAMPPGTSDFDRGMAAGMALARYLKLQDRKRGI